MLNIIKKAIIPFSFLLCTVVSYVRAQTFTDPRDNHVYKTIKVGNQTWMAENLAYLPKINSPYEGSDEEAQIKPFFYVYGYFGNDIEVAKKEKKYGTYGVLYNWVAAKAACPPGWHLPSDAEWKTLEKNLGMDASDLDKMMFRNSGDVGYKLKSKNIWRKPGQDVVQFNALPGGFRFAPNSAVNNKGDFGYLGEEGFFWSAT